MDSSSEIQGCRLSNRPSSCRETRFGWLLSWLLITSCVVSSHAARPKAVYELARISQELTQALANERPRDVFRMFAPVFQEEIGFERFNSAFNSWYNGRRIARARSRVVDIRGLGGHVSTWLVFEGASDYSYVYQNWIRLKSGWALTWLSSILDYGFEYGRPGAATEDSIADRALEYLVDADGLRHVRRQLVAPETVIAVFNRPRMRLVENPDSRPVLWVTPDEFAAGSYGGQPLPSAPFYFKFALIRLLGDVATCGVDLNPANREGMSALGRKRNIVLYLERQARGWQFHSVGKVW